MKSLCEGTVIRVVGAPWEYQRIEFDPLLGLVLFAASPEERAVEVAMFTPIRINDADYEVRPFRRSAGIGCDDDLDLVPAGFNPGKAQAGQWGMKNL